MTPNEIKQAYIDYCYEAVTSDIKMMREWVYEEVGNHADKLDMETMTAYLTAQGVIGDENDTE